VLVSFFHVLNFDQPLLSFQDRDMHGVWDNASVSPLMKVYWSGRWILLRQAQTSLAASYHTSWCHIRINSWSFHRCFLDDTAFIEWLFFSLSWEQSAFYVQNDMPFVTYRWVWCHASHCLALRGYIKRFDRHHAHILAMALGLIAHDREEDQ
jgi:hypothetical protein